MRKLTRPAERQKRLQAKRTRRGLRSREKAANYARRRQEFLVPALKRLRDEQRAAQEEKKET